MEMRMKETNPKVEKVEPGGQKEGAVPLPSPTVEIKYRGWSIVSPLVDLRYMSTAQL
jgi:hypothetical protein